MSVSNRLRKYLFETKKNVTQLANEIGVTPSAFNKVVKGEGLPSSKVLTPLAKLGVNINWLLTGEGEMLSKKALTKEEQKIINQGTISSIGNNNNIENKTINETIQSKEIVHLKETIEQLKAQLKDKELIIKLLNKK